MTSAPATVSLEKAKDADAGASYAVVVTDFADASALEGQNELIVATLVGQGPSNGMPSILSCLVHRSKL